MDFKAKLLTILLMVISITGSTIMAQPAQKPCESPGGSQFDFWVGEWDLTWQGQNGEKKHGTNTITKILGGCVIEENFDGSPSMPLVGKSISTYSPQNNAWKQLWVDNQGGYLDFVGQYVGGKMILSREAESQGNTIFQRMVWYNISDNELDWNWEKSADGINWELSWKIHYKRK